MNDNSILEPFKLYPSLKEKLIENTNQYFDALAKQSNVDIDLNRKLNKKYNQELKHLEKINKEITKNNVLKAFMIVLIVLGGITIIVGALLHLLELDSVPSFVPLLCFIFGIAFIVIGIVILLTVVKNNKKKLQTKKDKCEAEIRRQKNNIITQIGPLLSLFDYNMPAKIIRKTTPLIQIDDNFNIERFTYLNEKYGFGNILDKNVSTVFNLSGTINGNPFLFVRNHVQNMGLKTYYGSIVITYTVRVRDNEGYHMETRTQTLTASVRKPCPQYNYNTYLVYGNDAAPNLSFSRNPSGAKGKSEEQIEKLIKNRTEDFIKMSQKAIGKGSSFTAMSNGDFEALFNCTNRDNEVEYRLLFTPLAQQNFVELLSSQKPFGDDFIFEKRKCLNFIISDHTQRYNLYAYPENFYGLDFDLIKSNFVNYITKYFEGMFFDFAPLLSIPLYQHTKPVEYIYKKKFNQNYTNYEDEVLANRLGDECFKHKDSATRAILKTSYIGSDGNIDKVNVTAYSFKGEKKIDLVPMTGNDGRLHQVPVEWIEYTPLENSSTIGVKKVDTDGVKMNSISSQLRQYFAKFNSDSKYHFERGLLAFLTNNVYNDNYNDKDDKQLNELFESTIVNNHKKEEL